MRLFYSSMIPTERTIRFTLNEGRVNKKYALKNAHFLNSFSIF